MITIPPEVTVPSMGEFLTGKTIKAETYEQLVEASHGNFSRRAARLTGQVFANVGWQTTQATFTQISSNATAANLNASHWFMTPQRDMNANADMRALGLAMFGNDVEVQVELFEVQNRTLLHTATLTNATSPQLWTFQAVVLSSALFHQDGDINLPLRPVWFRINARRASGSLASLRQWHVDELFLDNAAQLPR